MGNIIRKDWYLESGVPALDTVAQVEEYLTYCKDTYGAYAYLYPTGYDVNLASAFNITPGGFNVVDGTVIHSFASQGFKDYLTTMNSWYEKGLFNDSFYNELDVMTVRLDMGNNKCSLVDGGAEPMSTIYTADPENDVELMAIDYFKADGVDEVHVGFESTLIKNADTWSISTTCENHIPLLELVNWLYSKEAELPYNWGEEGITYELDDTGTPHWTDLIIKNPDGLSYMFAGFLYASSTGSVFFPGVFDMSKGYYAYTQDQIDAVETLSSLTDGANNLPKYVSLTGEEQQEFDSYNTDISTYADGMILKFITGEESMDNYDDFVQTCVDMGLEEMTALYQTAYERSQEVLEKNS